jgi:benzoylformate decarboxylase
MPEKVTVREATLALLREAGMTTIFGNPGSTELPMFRDFPEDFRYILALQESVALGMADGFAQATRNAGFVNLHSSAGVGHALGNLFTAYKNQTPLVVTAGQQARSILPYEPFLFAERPTEFPRPFVKWSVEPARAEDVPGAIARAYHIAMTAPRGPVFVSVPVDDWDQMCEPESLRKLAADNPGDGAALAEVAEALALARKPALVLGAGVARDQAWHQAITLAERHNAAVWVAPFSARDVFPEDHPLLAGFLLAGRESIVRDLTGHDLVVAVGGPLSLYHTEGFGPHVPEGCRYIQIVDNPSMASWSPADLSIVANARHALTRLAEGPAPAPRPLPQPRKPAALLSGMPFNDSYLLQQISQLRPAGSVVVEEAPSTRGTMHDYLPITDADGFYTCASGGLGHGLPAAMGVALGRPNDKIIAVLGDGSSLYAIQGLWTAAQLGLPISFVIIKNGRYEALEQFGRHFGLQQTVGTRLPEVDFCGLARSQGISAERVDTAAELDDALTRSFAAPHPTLVEVLVE